MAFIGIDLGTTFSAVAALGPTGLPMVIANAESELVTPSVILFDDERNVVVGREAKRAAIAKPFYMGITTVTQKQWEAVMGTDPSSLKGNDLPVDKVSWNDAQDFCRKLSQVENKTCRLPTEAEWEYACRAGTTGQYGGAGNLDEMGWYFCNSNGQMHPVGQKKPNAWGLYDMHGNVCPWCEDIFAGMTPVVRGGSCNSDPMF